jgi:hypothetical protein
MLEKEFSMVVWKSIRAAVVSMAALSAAPGPACASEVGNTVVEKIGIGPYYDSLCGFKCMLIALASPPAGSPCAMNTGWHYAINIETPEGRVSAATAISAKATGVTVQANGDNNCVYNNKIERFSHLMAL